MIGDAEVNGGVVERQGVKGVAHVEQLLPVECAEYIGATPQGLQGSQLPPIYDLQGSSCGGD